MIPLFQQSDPIQKPFTGVKTLEFLGITQSKNKFNKPTIRFNFREIETETGVYRTVNATFAPRAYLVRFLATLLPTKSGIIEVMATPLPQLYQAINEQIGALYEARCKPSGNGRFTDIEEFWPLGEKPARKVLRGNALPRQRY
jgi:hypothetical protein